MEMYEAKSLLKYGYYRTQEQWEQARLISYLIAQTNSTKKLKLQDIIKFGWEEDNADTQISNKEIEQLTRQAEIMEAMFADNNEKKTHE